MCTLLKGLCNTRRGMVALPMYHIVLKAQKPSYSQYPVSLTTIGDHLRKKRLDLNLFQKDVAKLIGVERDCIYNWENDVSKPQIHFIPKIIEFLGYMPFDVKVETLGDRIIEYRKKHGLTQRKLAQILTVNKSTVRDWERNMHKPNKKLLERITKILG
jgi:DNA-binding XRE family transcriptional regulator